MGGKRRARLNEQFKREISEILRRQVRDPRVGTPTVTDVEVTPDLWMARVYVRPGPGQDADERGDDLIAGLEAAAPFVRRELAQTLTVRRIPELRFELDRTLDRAMRIEELLREVLPEEEEEDASEDQEAEGLDPGPSAPDPGTGG